LCFYFAHFPSPCLFFALINQFAARRNHLLRSASALSRRFSALTWASSWRVQKSWFERSVMVARGIGYFLPSAIAEIEIATAVKNGKNVPAKRVSAPTQPTQ
jgi:hypothetical protein